MRIATYLIVRDSLCVCLESSSHWTKPHLSKQAGLARDSRAWYSTSAIDSCSENAGLERFLAVVAVVKCQKHFEPEETQLWQR